MKQIYELTCWFRNDVDPSLTEKKVLNLIQNLNPEIEIELSLPYQKKLLAYKIEGETWGYLKVIYFRSPKHLVKNINDELKKHKEILRFLIVKVKSLPNNLLKYKEEKEASVETINESQ